MGADVAILAAAKDKRINCLVIHAARTNLEHHATKRFSESELLEIKMKGFINHPIHGKINHHFFDHLRRFDPLEEIKKISIPIFITHGKNDFQVPFAESKQLFFKANDPKYLDILDDADHEFRNPEHREHFYNMMIEWFNRYLRDKKA